MCPDDVPVAERAGAHDARRRTGTEKFWRKIKEREEDGMTREERVADGIAKRLAKALLDVERYDGDPEDVLDAAQIHLVGKDRGGAGKALVALRDHYIEDLVASSKQ